MKCKIGVAQYQILLGNSDLNLNLIKTFASTARKENADILLLPELGLHGYHAATIKHSTHAHLNEIAPQLMEICVKNEIALAGSFVEKDENHFYNTMVYIDSNGNMLGKYRKIHLFSPLGERRFFTPGAKAVVVDTVFGKIGLAICYDLRFPELFRKMTQMGAEGFLVCAEWPSERIDHWNTLIKTRAIENLAWIAGCNCTGQTGKISFGGSSLFVSPWGDQVIPVEGETLTFANTDPSLTSKTRKLFPFLEDICEIN